MSAVGPVPPAQAAPTLVAVDRQTVPHFMAARALVQRHGDAVTLPADVAALLGVNVGDPVGLLPL